MIKIFKQFFEFSGEQKSKFYSSLFYSFIHSIFEVLRLIAIAIVLDAIINNTVTINTIITVFIIMLVSIIGCAITKNKSVMKQTIAGYTMCANKRIEIAEHLKYLPMGYFNKNNLGIITSVTTNTLEVLQDIAVRVVTMYMQGLITTCVIIISMFFFDWRIGIIASIGYILFLFVNKWLQWVGKKVSYKKTDSDTNLVDSVLEYVQGINVVRSYNLDKQANTKVNKAIENNNYINFKLEKSFVSIMGLQILVLKLCSIFIAGASIYFYIDGTMNLLHCMIMNIFSFMIFGELELGGSYSALLRIINISINKVQKIKDTPVMDEKGENIQISSFDIKAKNISFNYDKRKIIDDISFDIPEGSTTAIVGPSGGGKSTICSLITRFWDVDKGEITIGNNNIKDYKLDSLLSNISMVFQKVYLFNDTIANNIRFGKQDATIEEIIEASKKACCHDFIMSLPNGYDTILGEGGATISGGEKQRISIARAIIKDTPIVILDEATANVDPENENLLQKAIEELTHNKTIIIIAHRLKTITTADQILVVNNGKIEQRGTHKELLDQDGTYKRFIDIRKQAIGWKL